MIENVRDLKFDESVNDSYLKKDIKNNDYGFVVYLCNSSMPVDRNGNSIRFFR